ncbi:16S rRNA (uracil(1498)-N(3))-methyltransferase [Cellulomonas telluris]|uniref:16S rRNA (uracil(1498)-N(3))-methyltransferase n=1 Tax=Cellulomonas telluris TaxID=2306636 RepID=UPI0010A7716E|nr:16S rRNA (uracil(1498)-N(3))-methyltransferase [Cellulomonas telluris]
MSAPVFLVEPGALAGVTAGGTFLLDGSEGRHAGVVQRRAPGERVDVVDGAGVRLVGTVAAVGPEGVRVAVVEVVVEPEPSPRLVLVQALAKGDRDEMAVEAATEVGVDAVVPWQAERSIVVWRGDRAAKSRARWVGTVRAATKQSRRARAPEVAQAVDGAGLRALVAATRESGGVAVVLHEEGATPLADVALPGAGDVLLVVGPEGGIGERELDGLLSAGAVAARLGPHVLRTSTAGPVALALVAQRLGRWG